MPFDPESVIARRHPEWERNHVTWRWLLDSYESGERYRDAIYGADNLGLPLRNLIRHKREYPSPSELGQSGGTVYEGEQGGGGAYAALDEYELRRARAPVPSSVADGIETHLAKVYGEGVARKGPELIEAWWRDCDGRGTPANDWFAHDVAPVFLALGQIDLICDRPPAPDDAEIVNQADVVRYGLDRAVVSFSLPENVLWWRHQPDGRYAEILLLEYDEDAPPEEEPEEPGPRNAFATKKPRPAPGPHPYAGRKLCPRDRFRYWDAEGWWLISYRGDVVASGPNPFGRVPVERVFYRRKSRERNVGRSFYEAAAGLQKEIYNRDSELILSDTLQAHPLLQGPEDYIQADGTVPIGPSWLLPKKKNTNGGAATYEGFEVVDFPKGAAESIRDNIRDLNDRIDRSMRANKPAGVAGRANVVAQSGVSKAIDNDAAYASYADHAAALARVEMAAAGLVLSVLHSGDRKLVDTDLAATEVVYPSEFGLDDADDLAKGLADFQALIAGAGAAPETETEWLRQLARARVKGRRPETYEAFDAEIKAAVDRAATARGVPVADMPPDRTPAESAGDDPSDEPAMPRVDPPIPIGDQPEGTD